MQGTTLAEQLSLHQPALAELFSPAAPVVGATTLSNLLLGAAAVCQQAGGHLALLRPRAPELSAALGALSLGGDIEAGSGSGGNGAGAAGELRPSKKVQQHLEVRASWYNSLRQLGEALIVRECQPPGLSPVRTCRRPVTHRSTFQRVHTTSFMPVLCRRSMASC